VPFNSPLNPERADYFDVGMGSKTAARTERRVDAYTNSHGTSLMTAVGQAVVLTQFTGRAEQQWREFKSAYENGDFKAMAISRRASTRPRTHIEPISARPNGIVIY